MSTSSSLRGCSGRGCSAKGSSRNGCCGNVDSAPAMEGTSSRRIGKGLSTGRSAAGARSRGAARVDGRVAAWSEGGGGGRSGCQCAVTSWPRNRKSSSARRIDMPSDLMLLSTSVSQSLVLQKKLLGYLPIDNSILPIDKRQPKVRHRAKKSKIKMI